MIRRRFLATAMAIALLTTPIAQAQSSKKKKPLERTEIPVLFEARIVPSERAAHVTIRLDQSTGAIKELVFRIDPKRHVGFQGSGEITANETAVTWKPPATGGELRYVFNIDSLRDERTYDARCAERWAIFRLGDLVPPIRSRFDDGVRTNSTLRVLAPPGWSVITPYRETAPNTFRVDRAERRVDRPVGWVIAGEVGVLRERIAGTRVAVSGPVGHGVRRLDTIALLRWTLPEARTIFGRLPERLLIVSADDPMWRGGLSGPNSTFLHSDRPLITSDGTSPILHELMHSIMRFRAGDGGDWIVEGLADLYSMELLVRSRTISRKRYEKSLKTMSTRGKNVSSLETNRASGAITARAVSVLRLLDLEIRARSEDEVTLDDLVRIFTESGENVTTQSLRETAERLTGANLDTFFRRTLPGYKTPKPQPTATRTPRSTPTATPPAENTPAP